MDGNAIRLAGLSKRFGPIRALDRVDLEVNQGEVFGFLGPNGAGKSTTIRILLDLIRPTEGYAEVLGQRPEQGGIELQARIGYLPGELRLPEHTTAGRYLRYLARLRDKRGIDGITELAERFDLDLSRTIGKLSKGNKQKIGVVQAFMHRPELLILDEPTSGLDPLLQHEFRDLAQERCAEGATLFMSSHVLGEIEATVERVAIIRAGQLVDIDDLTTLRHRAGQEVELRFDQVITAESFDGISNLSELTVTADPDGGTTLRCVLRGEPDQLLKAAAAHHVTAWKADDRELEDLFLDFYRPSEHEDD